MEQYKVLQGDDMLFRQIRLISDDQNKFQRFIIFVDATGGQNHPDAIDHLVEHGFKFNGQKYLFCERSASMVRQSMLSFVERHIYHELDRRVSMELDFSETPTVLSKYYAYRGLMLSSCHCLENWYPKMIVVPDYMTTIKNQWIEYLVDKTVTFNDRKTGKERTWTQKDIATKTVDIDINAFDGAGICHPSIMREFEKRIGTSERMNSLILRAPYIKGCLHEIDYERFFEENGVTKIKDIWGMEYDVTPGSEPMIIITASMYKGLKYFKKTGTYSDWERYWELFKKYDNCLGVAKWNFTLEQEPLSTRSNYQVIQDLQLDNESFKHLADDSITWYQNIVKGDPIYTYCFLGLLAENNDPMNHYMAAALRNPVMVKEPAIKDYIHSLLDKYRNEMKCGRLWMNATFKFWAPDLIALLQHIGDLPVTGCLEDGEFYSFDRRGVMEGDRLIERNPHISVAEHVKAKAVDNEYTRKYCSHLQNVAMVNIKSIVASRLNGSDFDGDLVLIIDNPLMMSGVPDNIPITLDVEDKITALAECDIVKNKVACTIRGLKSSIGEISNYATAYHNKVPTMEKTKKLYHDNISLLSICNGKAIDYAKTGVLYPIPRNVAAYGRPLPYFMKYAGPYYARLHNLSKAHSNMNLLCMSLERWERGVRWRKEPAGSFDWHIMYDPEVSYDQAVFDEIEAIFLDFNKCRKEQLEFEKKCRNWQLYHKDIESRITKEEAKTYETNWQAIYNVYRNKCKLVCPDVRELANILVVLCYEKYPNKFKKYLWHMAGAGVVENIKPVPVQLPVHDPNGEYEYLGQRYSLAEPKIYEARVK